MDCKKIKEMFSAYIDSELEAQEERMVKDHIASCQACRDKLHEYEESWKMLNTWDGVEPTPGYVSRFWTELSHRVPWYEKMLQGLRNVLLPRRVAYGLALALATLIVVHISVYNYVDKLKARTLLINVSEEEWEMIENYDLITNLDMFLNGNNI